MAIPHPDSSGEPLGRVEEILEIQAVLDHAAEGIAVALERSGADRLHPPAALREIARYELELAAVDIASVTFGTPSERGWR